MMLYIWNMTVPANTLKKAPIESKPPIITGIIKRLAIYMPEGCHGLVYGSISHRLLQLLPFNNDGGVRANGYTVSGVYNIEIGDAIPELILRGWSPSTTFEHEVTFRVNIVQEEEQPLDTLAKLVESLIPKPTQEEYPI